jgi:hypothetical protein
MKFAFFLAFCGGLGMVGCAPFGAGTPNRDVPSAKLASLLLDSVPPGYTVNRDAGGRLDVGAAAYSTPASAGDTRAELDADHFTGGYTRVWVAGTDYMTAAVYSFSQQADAQRFTSFETGHLSRAGNAVRYQISAPNDGFGFVLSSRTKSGNRYVFCQGGMFTRDTYVFIDEVCSATPLGQELATSLTANQFSHAVAALGSAEPAPLEGWGDSPTPK